MVGGDEHKIVFPGLDPLPRLEQGVHVEDLEEAFGQVREPPDPGVTTYPLTWEQQMLLIPKVGGDLKRASRSSRFWRRWLGRFLFVMFVAGPLMALALGLVVKVTQWLVKL